MTDRQNYDENQNANQEFPFPERKNETNRNLDGFKTYRCKDRKHAENLAQQQARAKRITQTTIKVAPKAIMKIPMLRNNVDTAAKINWLNE